MKISDNLQEKVFTHFRELKKLLLIFHIQNNIRN